MDVVLASIISFILGGMAAFIYLSVTEKLR